MAGRQSTALTKNTAMSAPWRESIWTSGRASSSCCWDLRAAARPRRFVIAGFVAPTAGEIRLGGHNITRQPPWKRNTGLVFQSYALFPHLTAAENIAFGLRMRKLPAPQIAAKVAEVLRLVRLEGLAERLPRELSGGQQQRVALARALVIEPDILLLDEPLSNLDAKLRAEVRVEIRELQRKLGLTTVMVTHDQEEALTMADRLVVMSNGRVQQVGSQRELY